MTPFELDTGTHPRTPYPVYKADGPDVDSAATFIEQLNALHNFALEKLEMTRQKQADAENKGKPRPTTFQESQLVLLSTKHVSPPFLKGPGSNKLRAKYIGPFAVTQRVSATSYELDLPAHFNIHPVVNIEYLKPYHPSPERFGPRELVRMELPEDLESAVWEVEELRGHRETRGGREFLCHWKGRPDHDDTWEKQENVKDFVTPYWVQQHIDQLRRTRVPPKGQKKAAGGAQEAARQQ
ncbi:MAG: chromo domain-containing protein [Enterococcus sp.]|nr:chromo domain-containing protein [Enterococcus sp.]